MIIHCFLVSLCTLCVNGQFGGSSSSLLLRSLVESLERNLVSKIEHVERKLRAEMQDFGDRLSDVHNRLSALEKQDNDFQLKVNENVARIDNFGLNIKASAARVANQFSDNLNIVGMSLTQLSDRTQVAEDVIKDLTGRLSKMETESTEQIGRILKIEEDVGNGPDITNEDLRIILDKVEDTMGGANAFELEGRIGELELKFDGNVDAKLKNTTANFDAKLSALAADTAEMNNTMGNLKQTQTQLLATQNATSVTVSGLSVKVEDAIAQSSALGDALAGSFQQYAMVTSQIYGLRAETEAMVNEVQQDVDFLNSTIELVAMSLSDFGQNNNALQDVYIIKGQVLLQEQTVNEMKARLEEKLADVDSKTESFQNEITNMQKFQESEGARQQTMWDATEKNTEEFNDFMAGTSTTITEMTSKIAITDEKLTKTFNLAESAKNGLKNINRRLDPLTSLEPKLNKLDSSVSQLDNRHKHNYLRIMNDFEMLNATSEFFANKLDQIVPKIQENTAKTAEMKKIKTNIETLRRNLQYHALRANTPGGEGRISSSMSAAESVSSEELENLKSQLESVENLIEAIQNTASFTENKIETTIDNFKEFQIKSASVSNALENSIAVASEKCTSDFTNQQGQLDTIKSSLKIYGDDLFDGQTSSNQKFDEMEASISQMLNKVNDFSHSQKTLSSYVNNFKQDVEISIAGYLTHFTQYIEKRSRGTQTTLRYVASTQDEYEQLSDQTRLMPFNDVVTDPSGSSNGAGIMVSVSGRYEISVTTSCVKGTIVYLKILDDGHEEKQSFRLYETAWSATSNSLVLDLLEGDNIMVAISEKGKVVDGKYNYLTVSLAEPV